MKIISIRNLCVSLLASFILTSAFFKNALPAKIMILLFLICTIAMFFKSLFEILENPKLVLICQFVFRISFFTYAIGFLLYTTYYSVVHKTYSLLFIVLLFVIFLIPFIRKSFFRKK